MQYCLTCQGVRLNHIFQPTGKYRGGEGGKKGNLKIRHEGWGLKSSAPERSTPIVSSQAFPLPALILTLPHETASTDMPQGVETSKQRNCSAQQSHNLKEVQGAHEAFPTYYKTVQKEFKGMRFSSFHKYTLKNSFIIIRKEQFQ